MLPILPYSSDLIFALDAAQTVAREHRHRLYSGSHLLETLLYDEVGLSEKLESFGVDVPYLKEWASIRVEEFPKVMQVSDELSPDGKLQKALEVADIVRLKFGEAQISPLAMLAAISRQGVVFNEDELKSFPITENELLSFHLQNGSAQLDRNLSEDGGAPNVSAGKKGGQTLFKYCVDKTELARSGKIDPIIGREGEVRMMAEILTRRTKPNVMIVGEPGVGKTALVEGFALKIVNNEVTGDLKKARVLEMDVGALVAGASYKGEVEDRLKKIIKEVKLIDHAILFIDEIHTLLDPRGSVGSGAANLLKPELARGAITVIGATTNDEYRKYIEKDDAFKRRFEVLKVEQPDTETAIRMLKALRPKYEEHHQLEMSDDAIERAVKLAQRYLGERSLPDTAVDLMDRTMAAIRLMSEGSAEVIQSLEEELKTIGESDLAQDANAYFQELQWFQQQIGHRLSPILVNQTEKEKEEAEPKDSTTLKSFLEKKLAEAKELAKTEIKVVTPEHVTALVSYSTGIPMGDMQGRERDRIMDMEGILNQRVIGQQHAVTKVADAVRIARAGINDPGKPVGSFFFLGPTGTGKTELAKALTKFLFNDEKFLIRFDMSEFKKDHSEAALLGAPPGYVGYEDGGPLINKIRQQPYSVVLFDEIEKAAKGVFDVFLSILDEGKATDKLGKVGDFSNAIILFTSNIGQKNIVEAFGKSEVPEEKQLKEWMKPYFRPEFLGRVGNIVPFSPITDETMLRIFDIHLAKLKKLVAAKGIRLHVSDEAKKHVAQKGFSPEFGARPLIGTIRSELTRPISKMIIQEEIVAEQQLNVGLSEDGELMWEVAT